MSPVVSKLTVPPLTFPVAEPGEVVGRSPVEPLAPSSPVTPLVPLVPPVSEGKTDDGEAIGPSCSVEHATASPTIARRTSEIRTVFDKGSSRWPNLPRCFGPEDRPDHSGRVARTRC